MNKSLFLFFIVLLFSLSNVYSCSCGKISVKYGFKYSDIIFTGKVVEINEGVVYDSIPNSTRKGEFHVRKLNQIEFIFKIKDLIKGKNQSEFITVVTSGGGADCGNYFDINTEHLVYSYMTDIKVGTFNERKKVEPYLSTSLCTRTKELKKTKRSEIKKLKRFARRSNK